MNPRTLLLPALLIATACETKLDTAQPFECPWYRDADGDGHGDPASVHFGSCSDDEGEEGWVSSGTDCDDADPEIHPDAAEICDDIDNDCDGFVDDQDPDLDTSDAPSWYPDLDGDGYGDPDAAVAACEAPPGYGSDDNDCDDADPLIRPDGAELCDGIDNDCDGIVDEDDAVDAPSWHADADSDGFGDPASTTRACELPPGHTDDDGDCDDTLAGVYPGADELCDGIDNDCDGTVDEDDAIDASAWYIDADGDGYGDASFWTVACSAAMGYAGNATDCDDAAPAVNPASSEVCDGIDNDCDGIVDEDDAVDAPSWYADSDGDGFGDLAAGSVSCEAPSGSVASSTDCDDTDAAVNPDAAEVCDGTDNDCDGAVDDDDASLDSSTGSAWYADSDGDGYGDASAVTMACDQPSGHVTDSQDCDDGDGGIHPAASEDCDGIDNDCDGALADEEADLDGDGYDECRDGDCDDGDDSVNPGASEICDGIDNDCDGLVDDDDGSVDTGSYQTWYADGDADGYGLDTSTTEACAQPSGYALDGGDCDDGDAAVSPSASEVCDGIDNDCDGLVDDADGSVSGGSTWYADGDLDGYGLADDWVEACDEPSGYTDDDSDCDDTDANVNPDASESCDGEDDDCDGSVDDGAGCPCSVATYDGHGYLFCTDSRTWDSIYNRYSGYGYLLATVSDASEQSWITSTAASYGSSRSWWIGFNDKSSEGNWVWSSGQSVTYTNWSSGQPDNGSGTEDCAWLSPSSGLWNDEQCWDSHYSVYEAH